MFENTYYITARPEAKVVYDWANHVHVSKHADARVLRAKARRRKRRR